MLCHFYDYVINNFYISIEDAFEVVENIMIFTFDGRLRIEIMKIHHGDYFWVS